MPRKEKHFFYFKNWFVFPLAVTWESDLLYTMQKSSRLAIHFLWWHWRWTFEEAK